MKVLSIDIDLCFEQGSIFRKYMNYNIDPTYSWEIIDSEGIDINPDKEIVKKIQDILQQNAKGKPTVIIHEHDEIIQVLRDFNCYKAEMFHFDAHHDVGYGGDFEELNIENWVVHAKIEKLIEKVNWTHNCSAEFPVNFPFLMLHDNILDIKPEYLPQFDLVVLCVSRHFTPMFYWDRLIKRFHKATTPVNPFPEGFVEMDYFNFEVLDPRGDYLMDGTYPDVERIFRNGSLHIVIEKDRSVSMFKYGDGECNIFGIKPFVDWLINSYGYVKFDWRVGCRNEIFIKRLIKNYEILREHEGMVIITKKGVR